MDPSEPFDFVSNTSPMALIRATVTVINAVDTRDVA